MMDFYLVLLLCALFGAVNGQGNVTADPPPFFFSSPHFPASQYHMDVFCIMSTADNEASLVDSRSFTANDPRPIVFAISTPSYCFARLEGQEAAGRRSYWFGPGTDLGMSRPAFVPTWCKCQIVAWTRDNQQHNQPVRIQLDLNQNAQFSNETVRNMWPTFEVQSRLGTSGAWTTQRLNNTASTMKATIVGNLGNYEFRFRMLQADGTPSIYSIIESTPVTLVRKIDVSIPGFVFGSHFPATRYFVDIFCINQTGMQEPQLYNTTTFTSRMAPKISYTPPGDAYCFVRVDGQESNGRRSYYFGDGTAAGLDRPSFVPSWCKCMIVAISRIAGSQLYTVVVDLNNGGQGKTSQFNSQQRLAWPQFNVQWRLMGSTSWNIQVVDNTVDNTNVTLNETAGVPSGVYQIRYQMIGNTPGSRSIFTLMENIPVFGGAPTTPPVTSLTTASGEQAKAISMFALLCLCAWSWIGLF